MLIFKELPKGMNVDYRECEVVKTTDGRYAIISNALQTTVAVGTEQECRMYLAGEIKKWDRAADEAFFGAAEMGGFEEDF